MIYFFFVFFVIFLSEISAFGRPRTPPSFMASKSASVYIPAEPIYIYGFLPYLWRRLFTASDEVFNRAANTCTVRGVAAGFFSSIFTSLYYLRTQNQEVFIGKMSILLDNLLYTCIVKNQKTFKKPENSLPTIDSTICRGYSIYISVQTIGQIKKRQPEAPVAEWPKAKGEFYERTEKFSGMA